MAERDALQKRYAYQEMSNKVEQADRSHLHPRGNEPSGEVESIRGRVVGSRMGDRLFHSTNATKTKKDRPKELLEELERERKRRKKKDRKETEHATEGGGKDSAGGVWEAVGSNISILDVEGSAGGYRPTHPSSRAAYESLLNTLSRRSLLGNQPPSVLKDAAWEVLSLLKEDNLRDPERRRGLSVLLLNNRSDALSEDVFAELVRLGKSVDDFRSNENEDGNKEEDFNRDAGTGEGQVDQEMGVAVVFDEDEEDEEEDDDTESEDEGQFDQEDIVLNDNEDNMHMLETTEEEKLTLESSDKKQPKEGGPTPSAPLASLHIHEIDAHWLQRQLSSNFSDVDVAAKIASDALEILHPSIDNRECENKLLVLLGFELFSLIKTLLKYRLKIWACIHLKRLLPEESEKREGIRELLWKTEGGKGVWEEIHARAKAENWTKERMESTKLKSREEADRIAKAGGSKTEDGVSDGVVGEIPQEQQPQQQQQQNSTSPLDKMDIDAPLELDLDSLAFESGSHTMSNQKCVLPSQTFRATRKGYEEVFVPATPNIIPPDEKLINISELPPWCQPAFSGMNRLNRIQSKMYSTALHTSENLLLCAPTGAGKTNVAMLAMLNILGQYQIRPDTEPDVKHLSSAFDKSAFKIIYIAPMKALVQEVVKNFSTRFKPYGLVVRELSGDSSLTRQQIKNTHVIVTTPEKWDVVTRQGEGRAFTQLVRLVILDEVHLLHEERGAVLETIVSRVLRQTETTREPVRMVGLSATLPNYRDVGMLLRVKPDKGLYFFDATFRPVPLQMQYIGIAERNAWKRFQLQNEICFDKCVDQRKGNNQVLIFVHSRAETGKTAKVLRDMALEKDCLDLFVRAGGATQEILREEVSTVKHPDLKEVLTYGFGTHHAGMTRSDRELVEDLFADGHIGVLCCTATLAWGVNLPAHCVILKGTQIYDPAKGKWTELSALDVLQMLGRAGRPQFDTEGEGIIMTQHSQLQYYLSLTNLQLPIESQLIKALPNHLNAEVVLGNIQTIEEAVDWLSYTFLYIRMLQNPTLYGVLKKDENDPTMKRRRLDLAHTAATILEKAFLVKYDRRTGSLHSTPLGRIASQYYISHTSISVYSRHLRPDLSDIELLRVFALSGEFAHITVREEEKLELTKLMTQVPIPVKEPPSESLAKVNILLQAYISRLNLDGFALSADMAFVRQSAARIFRALFEISLKRNWASLSRLALRFAQLVEHRMWYTQSPLRQIPAVPEVVRRKLERKGDLEWERYVDLTPSDLGELVNAPKLGRALAKWIRRFPRLEVTVDTKPVTRSLLRVDLTLVADFEYDVKLHGYSVPFHIWVEDANGTTILHHEMFELKSGNGVREEEVSFVVGILEPLPPCYFVRVLADRWIRSESTVVISFRDVILPAKFPPPTELLDLQPLTLPSLKKEEPSFDKLYSPNNNTQTPSIHEFNPIQTQTYPELFKTSNNVLVCAPTGSGKTVCAEFAILRMLLTQGLSGKCVYVSPNEHVVRRKFEHWKERIGAGLLGDTDKVTLLTGETGPDLRALSSGVVVLSTVKNWDSISRRWRQRQSVKNVTLFLADDLHFLGGRDGPTYEIVLSRMRYIGSSSDNIEMRIVGLSAPLANAREVAEWMGVVSASKSLFNFSPRVRPIPLEIYLQSFEQANFASRLLAMGKPAYNAAMRHSEPKKEGGSMNQEDHPVLVNTKPVMIFVPSKRQAQLTAIDLLTLRESAENGTFLNKNNANETDWKALEDILDPTLRHVASAGIAYIHEGTHRKDRSTVLRLYQKFVISVLVSPADQCWTIPSSAHCVIITGTESYDGREKTHVDYPVTDLLHMMGKAGRPHTHDNSGKCVIFCHAPKKERLKKLLYDPLPIESHLDHYLHDPLNSEIVTKTVTSMQDAVDYITWTLLYRRFSKNPNYYHMDGTSSAHLSEHMSEMVETVLGDLEESKCCQISEEGEVTPLNLGMIAGYYYIQYTTVELIASSVTERTKTRGVMEILSAASEFNDLPVRQGEERALNILSKGLVHKLPQEALFNDPNTKALVLLQCHFSRKGLSADMTLDQREVLKGSVPLIQAIVDVISSNGWLKPALAAMELSQMVVQGLWNKDNVLLQIPHFTKEIVERCESYKGEEPIEGVFDILSLEDDVRNDLLRLPDDKMSDVAIFCNNYPNVDVSFQVIDPDDVTAGDPVQISITLEREIDEDDDTEESQIGIVSAPLFPKEKREGWWIVVGDTKNNTLLSLKRVSLQREQKVMMEFVAPEEAGDYTLALFCMSDCYLGCDQEFDVPLNVAVGDDSDEEDEEDDDGEEEGADEKSADEKSADEKSADKKDDDENGDDKKDGDEEGDDKMDDDKKDDNDKGVDEQNGDEKGDDMD